MTPKLEDAASIYKRDKILLQTDGMKSLVRNRQGKLDRANEKLVSAGTEDMKIKDVHQYSSLV